uniref:C-type lectin domain-containing protein n=1 Tax=Gopherus agassizii TaxID=38772 RepID=A0A452GJ93_9SAUR
MALNLSGPGPNRLRKCASHQVLVPATITVLIIIIVTLAALLAVEKSKPSLAAPGPPSGPCCPDGWIGYRGKCYYFSETEGNWTYSQSQCSALNASLAGIDSEQEKVKERQMLYPNRLGLAGLESGWAQPQSFQKLPCCLSSECFWWLNPRPG